MKSGNIYLLIRYQLFKPLMDLWKAAFLALCLQFAAEVAAQLQLHFAGSSSFRGLITPMQQVAGRETHPL